MWRWWFIGDIEQIGAGRLSEHRRCFAGDAKVDGTDVQAFEQLRATGEFSPLHVHSLGGEAFFQRAFGFEQHQGAVLLITES